MNDPRNQAHFDLLGISPTVSATSTILALVEHEVPEHGLIHLLELRNENLEIVEVQIEKGSRRAGKTVAELALPPESRLISVTRDGQAEIAVGSTKLLAGRPRARDSQARPRGGVSAGVDQGLTDKPVRRSSASHPVMRGVLVAAVLVGFIGGARASASARAGLRVPLEARPVRLRLAAARRVDEEPAEASVRRRAARRDPRARLRQAPAPAVPGHPVSRDQRWRAGTALGCVPSELRAEPPLLRRLHRPQRGHADRRVQGQQSRYRRQRVDRAPAPVRRPAVPEPQRRPARVRAGRAAVHRDGRRRLGRRSREPAQNLSDRLGKLLEDERDQPRREAADRGLRAPQPVAVLVRPRDRRPVHRRRRTGRVGRDRLRRPR